MGGVGLHTEGITIFSYKLSENGNLTYNKRVKALLAFDFQYEYNCESMAYRSLSL